MKVLELMCQRETGPIFEAGGLQAMLGFVREHGPVVHRDTVLSAMSVITRLCGKMEPQDPTLGPCVSNLTQLLRHTDPRVSEGALRSV